MLSEEAEMLKEVYEEELEKRCEMYEDKIRELNREWSQAHEE